MKHLQDAYDPERFRADGHLLVDALADFLRASVHRHAARVIPWHAPADELDFWRQRMEAPAESLASFLSEVLDRSIRLHHPRYVGHQVGVVAPTAALAGLASELLNNGAAIYEMGAAATALERWIIQHTGQKVGFADSDGFLTSGGTLAMLTALLAARSRQLGESSLRRGTEPTWSVMASEESHYCVSRAVLVMGGGDEGLFRVPSDDRFKMRVDLLDSVFDEACRRGRRPFAVVASAGSTATGAYDDLEAIGAFCRRRQLWFHVDGAHGAAVAFSPSLRSRIRGIDRADSVILDFHKMLLTPALATAVLFRQRADSWAAFHQQAQYLWTDDNTEEWFNLGKRTFECTKLMMSVKIAALWRTHGPALIDEHLRTVHQLAQDFAARISARPSFQLAVEPESNIVCFRWTGDAHSEDQRDMINAAVRRSLVESGQFYVVQTRLRGKTWLRTALMNPLTTLADLDALLDAVEQGGQRESAAAQPG